mmetsp:Transcript_20075/g.44996  ORF Transcript_20075/g.44996 Transcript_20075/m.44996 type:complete len:236 (+) Transcript_20075:112-819(+)
MAVEGMESGMAQLSVRNTFIHVDDADNMNMRGRGTPRSRSVPVRDSSRDAPLEPRDNVQLPDLNRPPSAADLQRGLEQVRQAQERYERGSDVASNAEGDGDADDDDLDGGDPAELSIGSAAHASGTCKPCAWNWKPSGCEGGRNCEFCHICGQDELKIRRKRRVRELRASARRNRSSDSGHSSNLSDASSASGASSRSSRSRRSGGSARGAVPLPPGPVVREPSPQAGAAADQRP